MAGPLVAVDWGTSSLRAVLIGADGAILARSAGPDGITKVAADGFGPVLDRHVAALGPTAQGLPVVLAGMIGSRNGWVEVPYVAAPAGLAALGDGVVVREHNGRLLRFVPGLSCRDAGGVPDVMRGEEMQIFGAMAGRSGTVVLPGTHSKWADVTAGTITGFRTFMTGELFAVLSEHSILGRLAEGRTQDAAAFLKGVDAGLQTTALTHSLFSARSLALFGELVPGAVSSYLSGLLIGAEFGANREAGPITLIGEARLTDLYALAARHIGISTETGSADAALAGIHALTEACGWT